MTVVVVIVFVILAVAVWRANLAARQLANEVAMEACKRLSVQFLDGTVAFSSMRPARGAGRITLRRNYVFDYTEDGLSRRQGFVVLLGHQVEAVGLAADARYVH
jgi:hypothetical protein